MSSTFLKAVKLRADDAGGGTCSSCTKGPTPVAATAFVSEAEETPAQCTARLHFASCVEEETPAQRTVRLHFASCVEELFDEYAPDFEHSLVKELGYDIPALIEAALLRVAPGSPLSSSLAVDLGCGTGLAGAQLRSHVSGRLIGCDLSRRMLSHAAEKGVYAQLEACDCVAFLHRHVPVASADLIVAADVLVYMRSLAPLFAAARRSLRPGGLFTFSTERCDAHECGAAGWVERPSERIAHCAEYLRWLVAESHGQLEWRGLEEVVVRRDGRHGLRGHVAVLVRTGAPDGE